MDVIREEHRCVDNNYFVMFTTDRYYNLSVRSIVYYKGIEESFMTVLFLLGATLLHNYTLNT